MSTSSPLGSSSDRISRRAALKLGGGVAGGLLLAGSPLIAGAPAAAGAAPRLRTAAVGGSDPSTTRSLPIDQIQDIIRVQGTFSNGVLNIQVDRDDLPHVTTTSGVPIKPAFEINGNVCFQGCGNDAILNGDLCFKAEEIDPAIDQMLRQGLVLQAEHQHLFDLENPLPWFMHFRGYGHPLNLARAVAAVLSVTSTPLPQTQPAHPTTPLDPHRLASIIGSTPTVGADGIVSFQVPRRNPVVLAGHRISPYLNIYIPVDFQPLSDGRAVAVPDFGMVADEVVPLISVMRRQGWLVGCLYNQETDEQPQLYFSHNLKVGDPYELAEEIRHGLDHLDVVLA